MYSQTSQIAHTHTHTHTHTLTHTVVDSQLTAGQYYKIPDVYSRLELLAVFGS